MAYRLFLLVGETPSRERMFTEDLLLAEAVGARAAGGLRCGQGAGRCGSVRAGTQYERAPGGPGPDTHQDRLKGCGDREQVPGARRPGRAGRLTAPPGPPGSIRAARPTAAVAVDPGGARSACVAQLKNVGRGQRDGTVRVMGQLHEGT
ncbi:hypothetical protein GCM10010392_40300 [Streptomyces clavifer]|nr:hypothetical protein GCM10010392_40300 [Streptomyces clavifer]